MGTPQAVQRQIDKANAIQSEIISKGKTDANLETVSNVPAETAESMTGKNTGNIESTSELQAKLEQLNSRFLSYKKLYDTEVTGSRRELKDKNDEIESLKSQIKDLKESSAKTEQADRNEVLEDISNSFGPEFVDAVSNLSQVQLMRENANLLSRLEKFESNMKHVPNEQSKAGEAGGESDGITGHSFFSSLAIVVPNWSQINQSMQFKEWLNGADTNGKRRNDNLIAYHEAGNVEKTAELFHAYIDSNPSPRVADGDYLPNSKPGSELTDDDDVIHQYELNEYYKNKALRKYSPDEIQMYEAKINKAMVNGKIVP